MYYDQFDTPLGRLLVASDGHALIRIDLPEARHPRSIPAGWQRDAARLKPAREQFAAYFAGELRDFDLPLAPRGTPFQQTVWQGLRGIAYGETISYAELARRIGKPAAVRAVGLANGANPLAIIVPCHRVIGANGSLTGYGGGLPAKKFLLELEMRNAAGGLFSHEPVNRLAS